MNSFKFRFLVACLGFSVNKIMLFTNNFLCNLDAFFFFFSCLIALAGTSSAMLSKSGVRRCHCHVPHLKAFSFSPLHVILAVDFFIQHFL